MEFVDDYNDVLEQLDLSLADKEVADQFALWDVVKANDQERKYADAIDAHQAAATGLLPGMEPAINPEDGQIY
jgi:hypothetical protein